MSKVLRTLFYRHAKIISQPLRHRFVIKVMSVVHRVQLPSQQADVGSHK